MAALRNKKKLAALIKENSEEHPGSNLAQNSNVPKSQEDSITHFSEEIEGRVTKKLYQEFSRTENRIFGALARLGDFLMNPIIQGHSGTALETSQNAFSTSQGTNCDDSQNDPHLEMGSIDQQLEVCYPTRNERIQEDCEVDYFRQLWSITNTFSKIMFSNLQKKV